eukprot:g20778.t1
MTFQSYRPLTLFQCHFLLLGCLFWKSLAVLWGETSCIAKKKKTRQERRLVEIGYATGENRRRPEKSGLLSRRHPNKMPRLLPFFSNLRGRTTLRDFLLVSFSLRSIEKWNTMSTRCVLMLFVTFCRKL